MIYKRRLRGIRELKDINRDTLSQLSGVSVVKIKTYEVQLTSAAIPHVDLISLCAALDIPTAFLTDEKAAILWDGDKVTGKSRKRQS